MVDAVKRDLSECAFGIEPHSAFGIETHNDRNPSPIPPVSAEVIDSVSTVAKFFSFQILMRILKLQHFS